MSFDLCNDNEHCWYMVRVSAGFEDKVADALKSSIEKRGMDGLCSEIFIPSEDTMSVRRGKKVLVKKKLFPGYVFVKIGSVKEVAGLIKAVPRVVGFLGNDGAPSVISDSEIEAIKDRLKSGALPLLSASTVYEVGEEVKIIDGPFQSFIGRIDSMNEDRGMLRVIISIFGRMTKVELEMSQVKKVGG